MTRGGWWPALLGAALALLAVIGWWVWQQAQTSPGSGEAHTSATSDPQPSLPEAPDPTPEPAPVPDSSARTGPAAAPPPPDRVLTDPRITESSGLVPSRLHRGVLYTVNDSGGGPVVYAVGPEGDTLAALTLEGATAIDWEALAPSRDERGRPSILVGDIGDNGLVRGGIQIYEFTEPELLVDRSLPADRFDFTYPDGAHDAEALLVDPDSGALQIVTKGGSQARSYTATRPDPGGTAQLRDAGVAPAVVTGGAWELTEAGEPRVVLSSYLTLYQAADIEGPWQTLPAPFAGQREAVTWPWTEGAVADWVYVSTEGAGATISSVPVPAR